MNDSTKELIAFAERAVDGGWLSGDDKGNEKTRHLAIVFLALRGQMAAIEAERDDLSDSVVELRILLQEWMELATDRERFDNLVNETRAELKITKEEK